MNERIFREIKKIDFKTFDEDKNKLIDALKSEIDNIIVRYDHPFQEQFSLADRYGWEAFGVLIISKNDRIINEIGFQEAFGHANYKKLNEIFHNENKYWDLLIYSKKDGKYTLDTDLIKKDGVNIFCRITCIRKNDYIFLRICPLKNMKYVPIKRSLLHGKPQKKMNNGFIDDLYVTLDTMNITAWPIEILIEDPTAPNFDGRESQLHLIQGIEKESPNLGYYEFYAHLISFHGEPALVKFRGNKDGKDYHNNTLTVFKPYLKSAKMSLALNGKIEIEQFDQSLLDIMGIKKGGFRTYTLLDFWYLSEKKYSSIRELLISRAYPKVYITTILKNEKDEPLPVRIYFHRNKEDRRRWHCHVVPIYLVWPPRPAAGKVDGLDVYQKVFLSLVEEISNTSCTQIFDYRGDLQFLIKLEPILKSVWHQSSIDSFSNDVNKVLNDDQIKTLIKTRDPMTNDFQMAITQSVKE